MRFKLAADNPVPREGIGVEGSVPNEAESKTKAADNENEENMAEADKATTNKAKVSNEENDECVVESEDSNNVTCSMDPGDEDSAVRKVLEVIVPKHEGY